MSSREDRADALYGLPLERFVAERDALAKALRAEGDREGAAEIRGLAKPTRAAWAVNTAVREHPKAAQALAQSARLLGDAQRELLAGGESSVLREASERARSAVDALAAAAGDSGTATDLKVRETLRAAVVDAEVLAEVAAGRLLRERVASGFGGLPADAGGGGTKAKPRGQRGSAAPKARGAAGAATKQSDAREQRRRAKEEAQARAAAAREDARRQAKLRRANEAEAEAEHALAAARRALAQVESVVSERRAEVRRAEAQLKDARRRRQRAER